MSVSIVMGVPNNSWMAFCEREKPKLKWMKMDEN